MRSSRSLERGWPKRTFLDGRPRGTFLISDEWEAERDIPGGRGRVRYSGVPPAPVLLRLGQSVQGAIHDLGNDHSVASDPRGRIAQGYRLGGAGCGRLSGPSPFDDGFAVNPHR